LLYPTQKTPLLKEAGCSPATSQQRSYTMRQFTPQFTRATREPPAERDPFEQVRQQVDLLTEQFHQRPVTPASAPDLERQLQTALAALGRAILQEQFNQLEPPDKHQAAPRLRYRGQTYRINKKTPAEIATSFGSITLTSFLYLNDEAGEPGLHPLHVEL